MDDPIVTTARVEMDMSFGWMTEHPKLAFSAIEQFIREHGQKNTSIKMNANAHMMTLIWEAE